MNFWTNHLNVKYGFFISLVVITLLIFVPPVIVIQTKLWGAVNEFSRTDVSLVGVCGPSAVIEVSPWFYTYKFSGQNHLAEFRGSIASAACKRSFRIRLRNTGADWFVSSVRVVQ